MTELKIEDIKSAFEDLGIASELGKKKELLAQIEKAGTDSVLFARLFLKFYDILRRNLNLCEGSGLSEFLEEMDGIPNPLRELLEELDDEFDVGNYWIREKIKDRVKGVRKENMEKLINLSIKVFLQEEEETE